MDMNYQKTIRRRLKTLGLNSKDARQLASWFNLQVLRTGAPKALEHFKAVGDTLIGYISKSGYKAPWVKVTQGGFPTALLCVRSYSVDIQLRVAKVARAILLASPDQKSVDKLIDAASSPYKGDDGAISDLSILIKKGVDRMGFIPHQFNHELKSVFQSARSYTSRSIPTGTEIGLNMDLVFSAFKSWETEIMSLPQWDDLLYPLHAAYVHQISGSHGLHPHVGELGGVMEQGGKLRIFAAPNVLINNALQPIQKYLDYYREISPWDVFKDQVLGKDWVQMQMSLGKEISSIDLSAATCRFPLLPQLELAKQLGVPESYINLYGKVSRGVYKVQGNMEPYFGSYLSWTVGQPLGSSPSMSTFALAHGLLLCGLCVELGIDHSDSFRIMGDDVVTSNTDLALRYREIISRLGVSISEHKSFTSKIYAEFAGFSILGKVAVRPGRWKVANPQNIMGLISNLGSGVISELDTYHHEAKLLAFKLGVYVPPMSEYGMWIKECTETWDAETWICRDTSLSWWSGCIKYLQSRMMNPYFQPAKSYTLHDFLTEFMDRHKISGLFAYHSPCDLVELITKHLFDSLDASSAIAELALLRLSYEEYVWHIPLSAKRAERDLLLEVQSLRIAAGY